MLLWSRRHQACFRGWLNDPASTLSIHPVDDSVQAPIAMPSSLGGGQSADWGDSAVAGISGSVDTGSDMGGVFRIYRVGILMTGSGPT